MVSLFSSFAPPFHLHYSSTRSSLLHYRPSTPRRRRAAACSSASLANSPKRLPIFSEELTRFAAAGVVFFVSLSSIHARPSPALAAVAATVSTRRSPKAEHEFSGYTKKILDGAVTPLIAAVDAAKSGKAGFSGVREALKAVKEKRKEVQEEVLRDLNAELQVMRLEKFALVERSEALLERAHVARKEQGRAAKSQKAESPEIIEKLENELAEIDQEYTELEGRIAGIEETMERRQATVFSIAIQELMFVEKESTLLVERLRRQLYQSRANSDAESTSSKLSRDELKKDLEAARYEFWEQSVLPQVMDADSEAESGLQGFSGRIARALTASRTLQQEMEAQIRRKLERRFGDETRLLMKTSEEEVLKGFPEVEQRWRFGDKDVPVPNASRLHLYHGWKRWREDAKAELKKDLLENEDIGRDYVAQRQERIILERERVVAKTWHNGAKNRWEMDPVAVPYAVSKGLVRVARIRHDWAAMYLSLKGDENDGREYHVDIKEFDMLFEGFGGFDGLYVRMLAACVPTVVQFMPIPFSELGAWQQVVLTAKLTTKFAVAFWNNWIVSYARRWVFKKIKNAADDLMVVVVFPLVEFIIPRQIRMYLGMAWPEETYQAVDTTWYLQWQSKAETNYRSRKSSNIQWYFWFLIRSAIFCSVLYHLLRRAKRQIPAALGFGPLRRNPNIPKLRRIVSYFRYRLLRRIRRKKEGVDPIRLAFDQMKRVKNPPIPLEDFASVESMREEIDDIVTCLRNPTAFQEKGARAPRGVLIVGERGTGKTSLALAIAAKAKVPVVEIKAKQLEAGLWVGQSAANVREMFQTARDLAPVIIFVEDFDLFAGVRGEFIHTKKQDHEAFINQLLVELDGFEKQEGVVLIATTRNLKRIDEALHRPGRMDRVLHLQRPTQLEREKILQLAANETMDRDLIPFVDWKKVAEKTALLRPVELKFVPMSLEGSAFRHKFLDRDELMSYCSWFSALSGAIPSWLRRTELARTISKQLVRHLGLMLTREDLAAVVDLMEPYGQISNGIELFSPPLDWSRDTKFPHAVWAAGRSLIALLLPNFDNVDNIWLEPSSWEGIGCTKITKARGEGLVNGNVESRSYLEKRLVFCFGSHIAAQLLLPFGEENFLSSSELEQAQEIATRMVVQYGWGPDDSPSIYITSTAVGMLSMGNKHEADMAAKVEKMYNLGYDRALDMLRKNRQALEEIVEQLLQFDNLTGQDLHGILERCGAIQEQEPFFLCDNSRHKEITSAKLDGESANRDVVDLLMAQV